jgi:hypothetical protein
MGRSTRTKVNQHSNTAQPGDATFLTGSRNFSQVIVSVLIYQNQPQQPQPAQRKSTEATQEATQQFQRQHINFRAAQPTSNIQQTTRPTQPAISKATYQFSIQRQPSQWQQTIEKNIKPAQSNSQGQIRAGTSVASQIITRNNR